MMKTQKLIAAILAVAAAATFLAHGDDGVPKNPGQTNDTAKAGTPATSNRSLQEPIKSVLDDYLKIHAALADDSTNGISTNAVAISRAVKADKTKTLPLAVAEAADALAQAKDLAMEREAFKDLSQALIKSLADRKVHTGDFDEVFCPMANAYWLQTNNDISNPYLGHSMPGCGQIKRTF